MLGLRKIGTELFDFSWSVNSYRNDLDIEIDRQVDIMQDDCDYDTDYLDCLLDEQARVN